MVWNPSTPSDTEKIQDLGRVIRPNWSALETASSSAVSFDQKLKMWAINLYDRSQPAVSGPNTPNRIDFVGQVYCRNDGSNNELFFLDSQDPANEIQLTENGSMGSTNTSIIGSSIEIGGNLVLNNQNFITSWGYFSATGTLNTGVNINASGHPSTGVYNVSTTAVYNNANVGVLLSVGRPSSDTPAGINFVTFPSLGGGAVSFQIETKNRSGSHRDLAHYVAIIGGI